MGQEIAGSDSRGFQLYITSKTDFSVHNLMFHLDVSQVLAFTALWLHWSVTNECPPALTTITYGTALARLGLLLA